MANQMLAVGIYGTIQNPSTSYQSVGLGTSLIRSIEPFTGTQPTNLANAGITILTVIKMQANGTKVSSTTPIYLSNTDTPTVITAAI